MESPAYRKIALPKSPIKCPANATNLQSIFKFKVNLPAGQHDHYTLYIKPSGLTMANPAIYLQDDEQNKKLVADLRAHFVKIHELSGLNTAQVCAGVTRPSVRQRKSPAKEPCKRALKPYKEPCTRDHERRLRARELVAVVAASNR